MRFCASHKSPTRPTIKVPPDVTDAAADVVGVEERREVRGAAHVGEVAHEDAHRLQRRGRRGAAEGEGSPAGLRLNACMRCDEVHCSAYYLQSCGANRRSAGVVTDIDRPDTHVCGAASVDAEERRDNTKI